MKMLMLLAVAVGVAFATLIVVIGVWLAAVTVRSVLKAHQKHDPVEYYSGWGSYRHPIVLRHKITKEEADALAAEGYAYLIGYFDANSRLVRVVKMLRGEVFSNMPTRIIPTENSRTPR